MDVKVRSNQELRLLSGILNSKESFYRLYNHGYRYGDLFLDHENLQLYQLIINYYNENSNPPDAPSLFTYILKNGGDKRMITQLKKVSTEAPGYEPVLPILLIENSIELAVERSNTVLRNERISGLQYAERLRESIDGIVAEKFECYENGKKRDDVYREYLIDLSNLRIGAKSKDYIETGIESLDKVIKGIPKSHLTIIAARPGMGKSAFMLQLSRNINIQGYHTLIISMEMTGKELIERDISAVYKIDSSELTNGKLCNIRFNALLENQKSDIHVINEKCIIEDSGSQTPERIKSTIRKYKTLNRCDVVFIDYLSLVSLKGYSFDRYDLCVAQLSKDLREFAKKTNLPIILISQMNRQVEARQNKLPGLSDLRESGQLEQDAKMVVFLHRPSVYGMNPFMDGKTLYTMDDQLLKPEEHLNIIIAKNRSGKIGQIPLRYQPQFHSFESVKTR
ncbi:MAG: AAA family ATPase [Bacteroidetes bacterium]|nr:AAA family ATPase [Bacteroidota bacterium]